MAEEITRHLAALRSAIASVSVGALDAASLKAVLVEIRAAESAVASLLASVATRAAALAEEGSGPPAREFLLGDGRAARGRRAGAEAARAELIGAEPHVGRLLASGHLGIDHVDTLARQLLPLAAEQRNRLDMDGLLSAAVELPADTFARFVGRRVASVGAAGPDDAEPCNRRSASSVTHWFDDDAGMGHVHALLDPERYEALTTAIDVHTARLAREASEPTSKNKSLAATALFELATRSDGQSHGPGGRSAPHVTVVVGQNGAETGNGLPLSDHAARRLLCDATLQRVVLGDRGVPIDVGRRHRTATSAQWTALRAIYSGCAWPGCHRPLSWCQLHHIHEWERGGSTDLANLVPLCSEHHHRVHEGCWTIELGPDRTPTVVSPDGSHRSTGRPPHRICDPPRTGGPADGGTRRFLTTS